MRETGAVTPASLEFTTNLAQWRLPFALDGAATGDDRMWKGYLDVAGGTSAAPGATVTVSNIPFTGYYNVFVYFDGDNGANWRICNYEGSSSTPAAGGSGEDSENTSWGAGQNVAKVYQFPLAGGAGNTAWPVSPNNGEGNMLLIKGMKGSTFTLKAWGGTGVRAPINGFQIAESGDDDNDGLPNEWETANNLDPADGTGLNGGAGDPDFDNVTNLDELAKGTNPQAADTDNDGLNDEVETGTGIWTSATVTGTNPLLADSDGDGLPDGVENPTQTSDSLEQPGTDPNKKDTDGDGVDDPTEVLFATDPKLVGNVPTLDPTRADLLAYWSFDDASGGTIALDERHNIPGQFTATAAFSADGEGHSGQPGDMSLNLGGTDAGNSMRVPYAGFLNLAATQDRITVSFWQKLVTQSASYAFYAAFVPETGDTRGLSAHATWSDNNLMFDTAGCCDLGTQRLIGPNTFDLTRWRHITFVKNEVAKEIWIDGNLVVSGENTAPLPDSFSRLFVGSGPEAANQTRGWIDEFAVFGDALSEGQIIRLSTGESPVSIANTVDSDSDGMPDQYEDDNGLLKNNGADAAQDPDGDTLTNLAEFSRGTNPQAADTDADGLRDNVETNTASWGGPGNTGTNPRIPDTDGDGLLDGVETNTGTYGGISATGTDPHLPDTDGDGFSDLDEVTLGTNPLLIDNFPAVPPVIGYWPFDDQQPVTADLSPGAHPGTVNGDAVFVAGRSGAAGDYALDFDGIDDSVTTGFPLLSGLPSFTMAGWIKIPIAQTTARAGLYGQNDVIEFGMIDFDTMQLWTAGGGGVDYNITDGLLPEWTHVAVTSGAGTRKVYVNGGEVSSGLINSGGTSTFGFNIGGGGVYDGTGNFFLGQIDDVAVWKSALTPEQISGLFTGDITPAAGVPQRATFPITSVVKNGNALTLTWSSEAGASYTVKRSNTLTGGWSTVGEVDATGTSATWTDNAPPAGRAFYYVEKD